eukprot:CAMPEP_0113523276 /NCGR_PEP_ID=MMETSP0014_2-20120614/45624_1 /TAXON_ID=2857 /ORGANISM="Nitzschia sp." /LENGTH=160 /DNA_ID=CAMNT_0000421365 /DNA_START=511 /DNA_END=994 /DNA_ORIENTATION=- /assembly_acc=CAM_ASM_000159
MKSVSKITNRALKPNENGDDWNECRTSPSSVTYVNDCEINNGPHRRYVHDARRPSVDSSSFDASCNRHCSGAVAGVAAVGVSCLLLMVYRYYLTWSSFSSFVRSFVRFRININLARQRKARRGGWCGAVRCGAKWTTVLERVFDKNNGSTAAVAQQASAV